MRCILYAVTQVYPDVYAEIRRVSAAMIMHENQDNVTIKISTRILRVHRPAMLPLHSHVYYRINGHFVGINKLTIVTCDSVFF
jgi:hypothetical protein